MTACPTCDGHHDPGECKAQTLEEYCALKRRIRVVDTARQFLSSASCSGELTVDNCAEASRLALICAEAFETAAEKYVKGEK